MKVYVALSYFNDDLDPEPCVTVYGVFTAREQAEKIIENDKATFGPDEECLDVYRIEELELDEPSPAYYEEIENFGFDYDEEDDDNESQTIVNQNCK